MLTHPMLDQLTRLGLSGMAQAFTELETPGEGTTLTHADWLGLLVDREATHRRDKRLHRGGDRGVRVVRVAQTRPDPAPGLSIDRGGRTRVGAADSSDMGS